MYWVLVFLSLQVLVGSMWIQPTAGQTGPPPDSAVPDHTRSSSGARGTSAPETSTQVSSTNGSCTGNAFEGDFSDEIGEDGKPRTWCKERGGTCSKKCPTAFYHGDDMGCAARHEPGFMCCKSWEASDIQCTSLTDLPWEYACKDMTVCKKEGGKVLRARGLCGGKTCRRCCRTKPFVGDFGPLPLPDFLTDDTRMASLSTEKFATESSATPKPITVAFAATTSKGVTPSTSGATPPTSGATPSTSGATPSTSRSTTSTSGMIHPTSGATHSTSGSTPPTSGSTTSTSGMIHSTSGATPSTSGSTPPTSRSTTSTSGMIHSTSGATPSTSETARVTSGASEESSTEASINGSCPEEAFEDDYSSEVGEDGQRRTWCEERGGTCSNNECPTAFYVDDDMGCATKHASGFMCCQSWEASDIECTSLTKHPWEYACKDMKVCEKEGGKVLPARGLCGGEYCRRCCRKKRIIHDFITPPLPDNTRMASLSTENINIESFTTSGPATNKSKGPDYYCLVKKGECQLTSKECLGVFIQGLCGGGKERQCCVPGGNCFKDAEIKQLYITLRRFEDLKKIAYDAKPKCEEVDWTICIGFNLNRTDAKQVFAKVLPDVKFKDVVDQKKELTEKQCEDLLKHDMINKYIPRAETVAGDKCAEFPTNVKIALVSAVYRGDLKYSHKTAALIRAGDWCKVRAEYLDHEGYRTCRARGLPGIAIRMDWNAAQFHSMCKQ